MFKAWSMGAAIIMAVFIIDVFIEDIEDSEIVAALFVLSPLIGACVASYYAPRRKILLGISMVLPTVISFIAMNLIYLWNTGGVLISHDNHNVLSVWLSGIFRVLLGSTILCAIGSVMGVILAKIFRKEIEPK